MFGSKKIGSVKLLYQFIAFEKQPLSFTFLYTYTRKNNITQYFLPVSFPTKYLHLFGKFYLKFIYLNNIIMYTSFPTAASPV